MLDIYHLITNHRASQPVKEKLPLISCYAYLTRFAAIFVENSPVAR